ncbi:unnamed protein product [Phytophthora lilii]|uniref:Unnamed protein product n=1 Tax=Phytophthora lilii TaxID=2077276 RepID=A0A9W6X2N0_9STRA|nr:unnamed protein product [Phytophthora lilii]
MGRTQLCLVPTALPQGANLQRFHADAADAPLLSVVRWTAQGRARQLALDASRQTLLELQRVQPPASARSWFVGNAVLQDGALLVLTPLDPLLVLLGAGWARRARFAALYELLAADGNTWLLQLAALDAAAVERLCDVQALGDDGVDNLSVKVSQAKVTRWLRAKVERAAKVLAQQEAAATAKAAGAAAFAEQVNLPGQTPQKTEKKTQQVTDEDVARHVREAIDVVGNYLPEDWIDLLCEEFKVPKKVETKPAAKAATTPLDTFKRFDRRQTPDSGNKRPTPASTASAKKKSKLANVDRTGMKSLTSFFGKK